MASTTQPHNGWRVGFDLDGVVYDFRKSISDYLVNAGRIECSIDRALPHWDFFKGWNMTVEEYLALYEAGVDAGEVLRYGDPLQGSVEATEILERAGHSIHIVTDRSVGTRPGISSRHTAAWLADHEFVFHSLTFSSDKTAVATDFFIDDRYENYVARTNKGMSCHLLTRPWNQDLGDDRTQRVSSVEEFVEIVLDTPTSSAADLAVARAV